MPRKRKQATTLKSFARAREEWQPQWRPRKEGKAALRRRMMAKLSAFVTKLTDDACMRVLGEVLPYKRKAGPYLGRYAQSTTDYARPKRKRKRPRKAR